MNIGLYAEREASERLLGLPAAWSQAEVFQLKRQKTHFNF